MHALARRPAHALLFLGSLLALALTPGASSRAEPGGYMGDEVCAACHEDWLADYGATHHAKVLRPDRAPRAGMERGCESCHGPGQAHVEAGGGRGTGGPGWVSFDGTEKPGLENGRCLECHAGGTQIHWAGSIHQRSDGRCTDCHTVMKNVSDDHLLSKPSQTALCSQCHVLPRAQLRKSAHMPTNHGPTGSGWMDCGSCHNPHGTVARKLIAASTVNQNCYSCHADKRGPFAYEHAPVGESCLNCHDPHGSLNHAMLKQAAPRLCQTCHIASLHPSDTRSGQDRFVLGRACSSCHVAVHGSNHPSGFALTR